MNLVTKGTKKSHNLMKLGWSCSPFQINRELSELPAFSLNQMIQHDPSDPLYSPGKVDTDRHLHSEISNIRYFLETKKEIDMIHQMDQGGIRLIIRPLVTEFVGFQQSDKIRG